MNPLRTLALGVMVCAGAADAALAQSNAGAANDYVVRPGDVLRVRVWPDSLLSGEFPVEETGVVYLPALGEVQAGGRTLPEIRAELRGGYARRLRNPIVTVTPIFEVGVVGAVFRPGLYQMRSTDNVFDAISRAGGLREDAGDDIRLVRPGQTIELDAERVLRGTIDVGTLGLQSGDRIVVSRRGFRVNVRDLLLLAQTAALIVSIATR